MNKKNNNKIILIILLIFVLTISIIAAVLIIFNWNSFFNQENNIGEESMGIMFFQQGILLFVIDFILCFLAFLYYHKVRQGKNQ